MRIEFSTDNEAFDVYADEEIKRIFDDILDRINRGYTVGKIRDINGNTVGEWEM